MATTVSTIAQGRGLEDVSYEDLYARWEKNNWSAMDIDFSVDREHWRERMTEEQRKAALWNYAIFFHGEDAVADGLGPYIDAAPREEQKYFLATQQVDEARHAVFFKRFFDEVVREAEGSVSDALHDTQDQLTWGYHKMFGRLEEMGRQLRKDPSLPNLAAGVALYHLIIEGTLAQPTQHFIENYLQKNEFLPGFYEGMRRISFDEQRHIGFGMKFLAEVVHDPACREAVRNLVKEVTPYAMTIAFPPNFDTKTYMESLGFTMEELYGEAQSSMFHKLRMIGCPRESLHGAVPFPPNQPGDVTAARTMKMLAANLVGPRRGPVGTDPESVQILMETVQYAVDDRQVPTRTTIQWEFEDVDPWYLVVDNGSTHVAPGRAPDADLRLSCRFEDWVDVVAQRADPRRLMLTRKIRPKGSLRTLMRLEKMFA